MSFICITYFCRSTKICYNPTREGTFPQILPLSLEREETLSKILPLPLGAARTKKGKGKDSLLPLRKGKI